MAAPSASASAVDIASRTRGPSPAPGDEIQAAEDAAAGIPPADLKIILLGDSAAGKSKLLTRFLEDQYNPRQRSTFALTLYRYDTEIDGKPIAVDFWDTAGQERFASMHASYYYKAHACILVFDVTRKVTYTNLANWYKELRQYCETIPCFCIANKIDVDYAVTSKSFAFPTKNELPFYFVSAADGTNVVQVFQDAIKLAWQYKHSEKDFVAEVLELLSEDPTGRAHKAAAGPGIASYEGDSKPA